LGNEFNASVVGEEFSEEVIFVEAVLELINKFLVGFRAGITLKLTVKVVELYIAGILSGLSSGGLDRGLIKLKNLVKCRNSAIIVSFEISNGFGGDREVTKLKHG